MSERKELVNEAFKALLVTGGAILVSMASKKLLKEPLGTPESVRDYVKLGVAVTGSTLLVGYAQDKKWLPKAPFKSA